MNTHGSLILGGIKQIRHFPRCGGPVGLHSYIWYCRPNDRDCVPLYQVRVSAPAEGGAYARILTTARRMREPWVNRSSRHERPPGVKALTAFLLVFLLLIV